MPKDLHDLLNERDDDSARRAAARTVQGDLFTGSEAGGMDPGTSEQIDASPAADGKAEGEALESSASGGDGSARTRSPWLQPEVLAALAFAFALGVFLRPHLVVEAHAPTPASRPTSLEFPDGPSVAARATVDDLQRIVAAALPRALPPVGSTAPAGSGDAAVDTVDAADAADAADAVDAVVTAASVGAAAANGPRPPAGWMPAVGPTFERYAQSAELAAQLLDPANRFTIQVASYVDRASREVLAEETVAHLRANGVLAIGPLHVGGGLVVLAGASPTTADLKPLLETLVALLDPRGREGEYSSAFVRNIDDLIGR
jgi:hypothetical protein